MFPDRFKGRVALVTGGASGIGLAIARRLAQEGGRVVICERNREKLDAAQTGFAAAGLKVLAVRCDVSHEESVKLALERIMTAGKRLDIVVHSAGLVGPTHVNLTDYPLAEFDRVCAINLRGAFLVAKHTLPLLPKAGGEEPGGRLLFMASMAGQEGNPGMIGYSASKAALGGLIKATAREVAVSGITVNGLAPALIHTPLVDAMDPAQTAYMAAKIPMKRMGTTEEVASIACWIVSAEASFNTGCIFDCSGGRAVIS
jgi:3-oxoacyl-[acyl-carrier protein] reductase